MNNTSEEWKETVNCFAIHILFEGNNIQGSTFRKTPALNICYLLYNWGNFTDFLPFVRKFSDRSSNLISLTVVD